MLIVRLFNQPFPLNAVFWTVGNNFRFPCLHRSVSMAGSGDKALPGNIRPQENGLAGN